MDAREQATKNLTEAVEAVITAHYDLTPLRNWLFIHVIPRRQKVGLLYTPDSQVQNKPVHEGVVLRVWKPYMETTIRAAYQPEVLAEKLSKGLMTEYTFAQKEAWLKFFETNLKQEVTIERKSEFEVGDVILFDHYSGAPVSRFDAEKYRMIPEGRDFNRGLIYGKLDVPLKTKIELLNDALNDISYNYVGLAEPLLKELEQRFDLVHRHEASYTLSGK